MRQRILIAMAVALNPRLLIADEPTTALDVTVQAQIMQLLRKLREEGQMAVVLITHDLAVVAEEADSVAVMYAGNVVESGPVSEVFSDPRHPYTKGLLESVPVHVGRGAHLKSIAGSPPELHDIPVRLRLPVTLPARAGHLPVRASPAAAGDRTPVTNAPYRRRTPTITPGPCRRGPAGLQPATSARR